MSKITFIGDAHGKLEAYKAITDNCGLSFCVGDFGFERHWRWHEENVGCPHFINPGNHDWGPIMKGSDVYMSTGDFMYFPAYSIMTVRGAESIDRHLRTEGYNWFPNEELNYAEQLAAFDKYVECKPEIMVTHDCPQSVMEKLFYYTGRSQTRRMLDEMFMVWQPKFWIFGHHHRNKDVVINGTRFVCLDELEKFEIEDED